ncbi:NUDIX hydrolase [Terrabacter terrigena]|uniref:NUDIX hydrolase n=1 Tax=Terrabacter terrigena TaxID=574718 RepID=A0ABW3MSK7_9MICO
MAVRDWHGTPANVAPEEHHDIGWFSLEEFPPPGHPLLRAILVDVIRDSDLAAKAPDRGAHVRVADPQHG